VCLLEKAIYELGYELNNRPAWVGIPLQGLPHCYHLQRTGVPAACDDSITCSQKESTLALSWVQGGRPGSETTVHRLS
jgi:hypothetical protein